GPVVGGEVAPAEDGHAFFRAQARPDLLAVRAPLGVAGQEDDPRAVAPGRGQRDPDLVALLGQEAVRHLHEDAGAVARVLLAAARAAVLEVEQDLHTLLDDRVRLASMRVHDEADAAAVVLVRRIVESLLRGWRRARHVRSPLSESIGDLSVSVRRSWGFSGRRRPFDSIFPPRRALRAT